MSAMHVVLFDIDGTMMTAGGAGQKAMEAALRNEFGAEGPVTGIPFAGRTDRAITSDLFKFYGLNPSPDEFQRFLTSYYSQLPVHLTSGPAQLLPGIREIVESLAARSDVLLGLLTGNYRHSAQLKLQHFGLHGHFVVGGYGDDHHERDDVARTAVTAAEAHLRRRIPGERLWVIGDTPSDVQCGRAIGANVVAVSTGAYARAELEPCGPDHLFDDFSEPSSLLALFR